MKDEELLKKKRIEFLTQAKVPKDDSIYKAIELGVIPYLKNIGTRAFPISLYIENIESFDAVGSLQPHFAFKQSDLDQIIDKIKEIESDGYNKVIYIYENTLNLMGDIMTIRFYITQNIKNNEGSVACGTAGDLGVIVFGYGENITDDMFSEYGSASFVFANGYLIKTQ